MMRCFVTRIASYLRAWTPVRPVYDIMGGGKDTRLDIDVMVHMRLVEKVRDAFRIVGSQEARPNVEETKEASDTNIEDDIPHTCPDFCTFSVTSISGASPSFQGASELSNEEVLARMMFRMDMFDAHFQGMETMIFDPFQSIEIM
ncbi:hypothetical protein JCGZ_08875 [Jatropha curcas]|uniref:Uncharacterized protein n=1 Tax=Jatropha curcas TaxID=180498 RepID=A0A067KNE4_JATCU|nr:hypothetical protein JCGZ_08875 [Jatropha curcas]